MGEEKEKKSEKRNKYIIEDEKFKSQLLFGPLSRHLWFDYTESLQHFTSKLGSNLHS